MSERPIDEIIAALEFAATIPPDRIHEVYPMWHGHALHAAYWAGLDAARTPVELAAPGLLAACEPFLLEMVSVWDEPAGEISSCNAADRDRAERYEVFVSRSEMDALRAAIAKAKELK